MNENLHADLVKIKEDTLKLYSNQTALRSAINCIPYIGGPIDTFLSGEAQKIIEKRIFELINNLDDQLKEVSEEKVDNEYIYSEEFFELIFKSFDAAARTKEKDKIALYAKIIKNSVIIQDREQYSPDDYLSVITELSYRELKLTISLYEMEKAGDLDKLNRDEQYGWLIERTSIEKDDLTFYLKRAEGTGLISELTGVYNGSGQYRTTPILQKIIEYISTI